jgi:hypothetical protein
MQTALQSKVSHAKKEYMDLCAPTNPPPNTLLSYFKRVTIEEWRAQASDDFKEMKEARLARHEQEAWEKCQKQEKERAQNRERQRRKRARDKEEDTEAGLCFSHGTKKKKVGII